MWWRQCFLLFYLTTLRLCKGSQLYFQLLQAEDAPSEKSLYHRDGTRPHPSDRLPIEGIMESPDKYYDPRPGEMNKKRLRKTLGNNFDPNFMSVNYPDSKNGTLEYRFRNGRPVGKRPTFLRLIRTLKIRNGPTLRLKVGKKNRRKLQKFLWSYSYCPVKYVWRDLGRRFWPRWIKDGLCSKERSCSVPPGMFCKPSNSTTKTVLRWHCPKWRRRISCKWIKIQYPIITECACSCHRNDDD